jgi:conjugal transfer mating pair stabilization protein TraG
MRFYEFKIIKEAESNIAVIGDSIAVGIKGAGKVSAGTAVGGSNTSKVLGFVKEFVSSGAAKGATVILSSGAANSSKVITADGKTMQQENFAPIATQIKLLKNAGATVALVGVGSKKTPPQKPTQYTNGQTWVVDYTGVNNQLESIASANGATFLGPLEQYDSTIGQGDGIHPYKGYGKLFQAGSSVSNTTKEPNDEKAKQGADDKKGVTGKFSVDVPAGRKGIEVRDMQQALMALGFDLPKHGADGIRGPETENAIKEFQKANGLEVNGDPGPETIAALNKVLASKPDVANKLVKSTVTDLKAGTDNIGKLPPLATDSATKGKVGEVLNFIARYESRGDYNIILGGSRAPLTNMTISQVFDLQRDMLNKGKESSAVGRYQYIGSTLREMVKGLGIDPDTTKFDEKTQDNIAVTDMRRRCGLDAWLAGKQSDEDFLNRLSRVWASIPNTRTGGSFYAGVGSNKAGTRVDVALNTLQNINTATA